MRGSSSIFCVPCCGIEVSESDYIHEYILLTGEEQASEEENHCPNVRLKVDTNHALDLEEVELDSEAELMRSMGLPLQFGGQSAHRDFVVNLYLLYLFLFVSCFQTYGHASSQLFLRWQFMEMYLSCL